MYYSIESDFYFQQHKADRQWALASSLAVCVHLAVFLLVMYMPSFFDAKPILEEAVSVSLVSMPDAPAQSAPPAEAAPNKPVAERQAEAPPPPPAKSPEVAAPPEPVAPPPPPPSKPPVPVAAETATAPPEPVVSAKPVSIMPEHHKVKKAQDLRLEEDKTKEREEQELKKKLEERKREAQQRQKDEQELQKKIEERKREAEKKEATRREAERQKAIAQAKNEQIRAENEARQAAAEAKKLEAEARSAREAAAAARSEAARQTQAMQNAVSQTSTGRQHAQSIVEQQYWSAIAQKVKKFWVLPEMRKWDANLLAQVVITINKNGEVTSIQFDQRSRDPLFDQLVEKTIRSAAPMPRFPALMQQDTTEVGFKFRPGELGNM